MSMRSHAEWETAMDSEDNYNMLVADFYMEK